MTKYILFGVFMGIGVPLMTAGAWSSRGFRQALYAALVVSTALGDAIGINFLSNEGYRGADRGFEITLTELIALSLWAALKFQPTQFSQPRRQVPGSLWFLVYALLAALSALVAENPLFAWFSVWKLPRVYLVFAVVYRACIREPEVRTVLDGLWWGMALTGLLIGLQAVQQKYLLGIYRIKGPFDHSNTVPIYLHSILAPLLLWTMADETLKKGRVLLGLSSVLAMLFAILATQSRAGLLIGGACVVLALGMGVLRRPTFRMTATVFTLAVVGSVGLAFALDTIVQRFESAPESSEMARNEFNAAAEDMARDHFLGVGINNFAWALTRTEAYREHIVVMADEEEAGMAHHIYLLTAAEMGWIGLASFLALLVAVTWPQLRFFLADRRGLGGLIAWGGLLGTLAVCLTGFFEWALRITPALYLFFLTKGLVLGLEERQRRPGQTGLPTTILNSEKPIPRKSPKHV